MDETPHAPCVASPYSKAVSSLSQDPTLVETLRFTVPLWIHEVRQLTDEQRTARALRCARLVGEKGDALQFKSEWPAGRAATAQAFNALAEGLAYAAYLPGGVTFAGLHWCVEPCVAEQEPS